MGLYAENRCSKDYRIGFKLSMRVIGVISKTDTTNNKKTSIQDLKDAAKSFLCIFAQIISL